MPKTLLNIIAAAAASLASVTISTAATVPFAENFTNNSANWFNAGATSTLDWIATGGPDGSGYASTTLDLTGTSAGGTPVLMRAQDEFGSSGGAFIGNYISEGVTQFSAYVRHDAAAPINFFARFSGPGNFPGAVAVSFAPVLPNQWTQISFAIDASNPQFVSFEGFDFNTVFSSIGHIQVGPSIPAALAGTSSTVRFDIDGATIVPEPATALLAIACAAALLCRMRRRRLA